MTTGGINLQEMSASAKAIIDMLQGIATQTVGYDVLWCRATPEINSEDVILLEYTLTNIGVECPKQIKVILGNNDYNPGNFTVDLFGINYDAPMEVHIPILDWYTIFGAETMPQLNDVVYIKMLHKIFEVKSSQIMYTIASMPTYFKCQLAKYNPQASRRETQEFRDSIEAMTTSQESLFGEAISQEVADTVVEVETAYNTTAFNDPFKDFDVSSIIYEPLHGPDGNEVSHAYYSMKNASIPVSYNVTANYLTDSERKHWIFTSWFRTSTENKSADVVIKKLSVAFKEKTAWYFKVVTKLELNDGDVVTIKRGSMISVLGEVVHIDDVSCEDLLVKIPIGDINRLNKKLTNWYESGSFKISKESSFTMFTTDNESMKIDINTLSAQVTVKFGAYSKSIALNKKPDFSKWSYMAIDFSEKETRIVLEQLDVDGNATLFMNEMNNQTYKMAIPAGEFGFTSASIPNSTNLEIRNIRLYENDYEMDDTYKLDMMSEVTRNASRLIIVDAPNVPQSGQFYSPVR